MNAKRLFEFVFEFPASPHLDRTLAWIIKSIWRNHGGRLRRARELHQDANDGPGGHRPRERKISRPE
jgi:hypothetical protein